MTALIYLCAWKQKRAVKTICKVNSPSRPVETGNSIDREEVSLPPSVILSVHVLPYPALIDLFRSQVGCVGAPAARIAVSCAEWRLF